MTNYNLSSGAIEAIINGQNFDKPVLQVISSKKITTQGSNADRYRLLLSDGVVSYSHAMLATQLNSLMESGELDNLAVVQVDKFLCNTIQGDRRVLIILDLHVLHKGSQVGQRLGNPQQYKAGAVQGTESEHNSAQCPPQMPKQEGVGQSFIGSVSEKQVNNNVQKVTNAGNVNGAPKGNYSLKANTPGGTPGGSTKVHKIDSLTPYQNRWRIRARVTQKSGIRTWSNSRGEGKLFSVTLTDDSAEIRATGFNDAVDKFYDLLEVNKVYYFSKASLKTANKQYTTVQNDYEMTFNADTMIEPCDDDSSLPTMNFNFVKINELDSKAPNSLVDVIGVVKTCGDVSTIIGKQSKKEITKRDLQLVDQSGMSVNMTLWGADAQQFDGSGNPVLAVKGAKVSDYGGRSLSAMASSQIIHNPDLREGHMLKGWFEHDGHNMDFQGFRNDGMGGGGGGSTNWKSFAEIKSENIGADKPEYFTTKATVLFLRKENCMYQACPTESCNKKVVDQGNGMYRCEKWAREFPNYKWRMILSANLGDYSDNQWVTCFQESAEAMLGVSADDLGSLKDSNESAFDQVFQDALFKSYIFKLRAKVETYNDESRLKTVTMNAGTIDFKEQSQRLIEEIKRLQM
ncbi:replication protein A 70 kDa DNA-binding subunit-like isoform X2 [Saccostrea echinata]|uniref:replication protein A 70 kDa DNA-binding subunit-like isoform X2 n=1 Tax=Saccostrea echinata TaxID=191078 RepID=UPI002A82B05F|nr:replication protein A 70 kDa DNA-binding subunit-like isoform X2 [Saccostrea echinata]